VAWVAILLVLSWVVLEVMVGVAFVADHYRAYEGTVLAVHGRNWLDHLTLEFTPVDHLIIETDDGRILDRRVTVENRAFYRVEAGDQVVKARGFNSHAHVPGKPTVQDLIDAAAAAAKNPPRP